MSVKVHKQISELDKKNISPGLAVILVGDNPASKIYVKNKQKFFTKNNCHSKTFLFKSNVSEDKIIKLIYDLNSNSQFHGILVQLPLPGHINSQKIINAISPHKDVDGFHPENLGKLFLGYSKFIPCTPYGILELLKYYRIDAKGKHAVIVGRSNIVGKPMVSLLSQSSEFGNATVTVCHSKTKSLKSHTLKADILIAATGVPNLITCDMVNEHCHVVDVGINRIEDDSEKGYRIVGDVDFEGCKDKVLSITPVPGGVGPMTIMMLLVNTVQSARDAVVE